MLRTGTDVPVHTGYSHRVPVHTGYSRVYRYFEGLFLEILITNVLFSYQCRLEYSDLVLGNWDVHNSCVHEKEILFDR